MSSFSNGSELSTLPYRTISPDFPHLDALVTDNPSIRSSKDNTFGCTEHGSLDYSISMAVRSPTTPSLFSNHPDKKVSGSSPSVKSKKSPCRRSKPAAPCARNSTTYTRAPRQSLKDFSVQQKMERIKDQNNEASQRYRARKNLRKAQDEIVAERLAENISRMEVKISHMERETSIMTEALARLGVEYANVSNKS